MAGQEFAALVPLEPKPRFRYREEGAGSLAGTMIAHQLMTAIKERCSPEEAIRLLKELHNPLKTDDDNEPTHNPLKIEVFTETLLFVGSKSFSHAFAAIAKFHYVFRVSFWGTHIYIYTCTDVAYEVTGSFTQCT